MSPELIAEIASLIATIGPLGVTLLTKLEGSLNLGPDEKTNIANAIAGAEAADEATIAAVNTWLAANPA